MERMGLTREEQTRAVARLRAYFERERDEELGELAAGLLLDFLVDEIGPLFYNRGINEAQMIAQRAAIGLEEDLEVAKRMLPDREERPARD